MKWNKSSISSLFVVRDVLLKPTGVRNSSEGGCCYTGDRTEYCSTHQEKLIVLWEMDSVTETWPIALCFPQALGQSQLLVWYISQLGWIGHREHEPIPLKIHSPASLSSLQVFLSFSDQEHFYLFLIRSTLKAI